MARDDRDSFLRPTEGGVLAFTYEQLLGDFTAPILSAEASQFFTVWQRPDGSGRHVVALRSQVSWAGDDTPVYERFYAGGIRSLRGFEFRGVGPIENGFNVGGDFMFLNSVEYQVPVLANDQIYFVGFVDSGTVEPSLASAITAFPPASAPASCFPPWVRCRSLWTSASRLSGVPTTASSSSASM